MIRNILMIIMSFFLINQVRDVMFKNEFSAKIEMAKKAPVSVNWQTVLILIPIADLFAVYRIEKLRLYLLIFWLGFGVGSAILESYLFPEAFFSDAFMESDDLYTEGFLEVAIALTLVSYGLAVILIRIWSRSWNDELQFGLK